MKFKSLSNPPAPTFIHFFVLMHAAYLKLSPIERKNAVLAVLTVCAGLSLGIFVLVGETLGSNDSPRLPMRYRMSAMMPANITVEAPSEVPKRKEAKSEKNDTSPRSPSELAPVDTEAYIRRWKDAAIKSMRATGVPASIILAQGIVESNSGKSYLATKANNHFGIKCGAGNKCRKGHCINRTDDSHKDFFLKFKTADQAFIFHGKFLSQGRYKKLHKYGRDYRKWANGLKSVGYATASHYAGTLINTIENYQLYRYD